MRLLRGLVSSLFTRSSLRMSRGAFILFEGVDRCGKTTQTGLLASYLSQKTKTEQIRFPDRTSTIGQMINTYLTSTSSTLNDHTIHLLFSANRWESSSDLISKLRIGTTLVCDRYAYSGVAFSSAKGMDLDWCKACDKGLPAPDVIIYLDIPIEDASLRGEFGNERYEKIEFQKKVSDMFMVLKTEDSDTHAVPWYVLDARKSIDELRGEIATIAVDTIERVKNCSINSLWV